MDRLGTTSAIIELATLPHRSRVFVDIGEPLTVPAGLLPRYMAGGDQKRAATNELMTMVLSLIHISEPTRPY